MPGVSYMAYLLRMDGSGLPSGRFDSQGLEKQAPTERKAVTG